MKEFVQESTVRYILTTYLAGKTAMDLFFPLSSNVGIMRVPVLKCSSEITDTRDSSILCFS